MLVVLDVGAQKKQKIEPSYAWALTEPLGLRTDATIDTLFVDYHRFALPWSPSHVWATTGNYGAPGQDQLFFNRPITSEFFTQMQHCAILNPTSRNALRKFSPSLSAWNT